MKQPRHPLTPPRPASEWRDLVRAFRQSGQSAAEFAQAHGVKARTLLWWDSTLRSKRVPAPHPEAPRLLPVVVESESRGDGASGWELRTARGHLLQGHDALSDKQLHMLLDLLLRAERSR